MIDPPAYVHRVQKQAEQAALEIVKTDPATYAITRAPNTKKPNGRINVSDKNGELIAVSVSPLNPKFKTQIEEGVLETVELFLDKNYITMSSCQGHPDVGSCFFVMIAHPDKHALNNVCDHLSHVKGILMELSDSQSNVNIEMEDGIVKKTKRLSQLITPQEEALDINYMYLRKHERYYFLKIKLFDRGWDCFFCNPIRYTMRVLFFNRSRDHLNDLIRSLPVSLS